MGEEPQVEQQRTSKVRLRIQGVNQKVVDAGETGMILGKKGPHAHTCTRTFSLFL